MDLRSHLPLASPRSTLLTQNTHFMQATAAHPQTNSVKRFGNLHKFVLAPSPLQYVASAPPASCRPSVARQPWYCLSLRHLVAGSTRKACYETSRHAAPSHDDPGPNNALRLREPDKVWDPNHKAAWMEPGWWGLGFKRAMRALLKR